jgi:hypothetical protein
LTKATIHKYKCIENAQSFDIEPDITVLVGMNESGKTSILEALAKVNYFEKDNSFRFDLTHDYPRKQKKIVDKSGEDPIAITLYYSIDAELANKISADVGVPLLSTEFSVTKKYAGKLSWNVHGVSISSFSSAKAKALGIKDKTIIDRLSRITDTEYSDYDAFINSLNAEDNAEALEKLQKLNKYFSNLWKGNPIDGYIVSTYLKPNLPQFMYYDDYYMLPSRVDLNNIRDNEATEPSVKTAKALMALADIDINKVVQSDSFEDFIAELEATQAIISNELFNYWTTNKNLEILFQIDKVEGTDTRNNTRIVNHVLDIRVKNRRSGVSLPLGNRSKGFNWFFSFLVWFKKIQENKNSTYILLLDEPGLVSQIAGAFFIGISPTILSTSFKSFVSNHKPPAHSVRPDHISFRAINGNTSL